MINLIVRILCGYLLIGVATMIMFNVMLVGKRRFKSNKICFCTLLACIYAWPMLYVGFIVGYVQSFIDPYTALKNIMNNPNPELDEFLEEDS